MLLAAAAGSTGGGQSRELRRIGSDLRRRRPGSIDRVYEEFGATVFGFLSGMLRDHHSAEDVQQQVFLEAWQKADRFDPARGTLLSWLLAIARSRALDHLRRRVPTPVEDSEHAASGEQVLANTEIDSLIEEWQVSYMLSTIPRDEAEMLKLRFYEDLSQSQIAERTGIPIGTVKMRMVAGLGRLRVQFEQEEATPR